MQDIPFDSQELEGVLCTSGVCSAGHIYPVQMTSPVCDGCKQQMLVIRMINCPQCNEATARYDVRVDIVPVTMHEGRMRAFAAKRCQGEAGPGESLVVEVARGAIPQPAEPLAFNFPEPSGPVVQRQGLKVEQIPGNSTDPSQPKVLGSYTFVAPDPGVEVWDGEGGQVPVEQLNTETK